jgi:tetratricopeptide (TPR) repeat protein
MRTSNFARVDRLGRVAVIFVLAVTAAGCAAKRVHTEVATGLGRGDREAAGGCYRCLTAALDIYQALAPRDPAQRSTVDDRIFRTSILLGLRERELGLSATTHFDRARELAPRLADPAAATERLEFAAMAPRDPTTLPRDAFERELRGFAGPVARIDARAARAPGADAELDTYIDVSLACHRGTAPGLNIGKIAQRAPASAAVGFLTAVCTGNLDGLRSALAREPRFVEAQFFIGRHLAGVPRPGSRPTTGLPEHRTTSEGMTNLSAALAAFPESISMAMDLATLQQGRDYREAHRLFTSVTARVPTHHDAWFGAGIALSYMGRHDEAVAAFTRLLELGRFHVGDALYWRAWNRHQLKDLEPAWTDVEDAKKTLYNTNVYALAGFIAYDRHELDVARPNLEKALEIEALNCAAAWYLGLVHTNQSRWPDAARAFENASGCYRKDTEVATAQKAAAETSDWPAQTKAAHIALAEETIREAARQEATAAYNAAYAHINNGDRSRARALLERARQHDDMKARAAELLAFLDKGNEK